MRDLFISQSLYVGVRSLVVLRYRRPEATSAAVFQIANVLQMPLPPKARRRKTDKIDTARMLREYLTGMLPLAYQPSRDWREIRRLVALRESLVSRRTALRNWIGRYLAHETWEDRSGLWSVKGMRRLRAFVASRDGLDRVTLEMKLDSISETLSHTSTYAHHNQPTTSQ